MTTAQCPKCGAVDQVVEPTACWQCGLNLVPGCLNCQRPVSLAHSTSDICPHCEDLLRFTFIVRPTFSTA